MATETMIRPQIGHLVVGHDEWVKARLELLAREKDLRRQMDAIARERRNLPWERVEKQYLFDTHCGERTLADLFNGKSQLLIYHFMLGPGWEEGCKGCSFISDHFDGMLVHLGQRDVSFVAVSRAPLNEIEAFKTRMGWRFPWVSSFGSRFNYDYRVSFTPEQVEQGDTDYNYGGKPFASTEAPGLSAFFKDPARGDVYHTYSAYARGLDIGIGAYNFLDMAPKGRDEEGLPMPMAWLRHHDRYDTQASASTCGCEQ
jgi:predicted dithiol-disulfide oxidoreductase (DUF899 family)